MSNHDFNSRFMQHEQQQQQQRLQQQEQQNQQQQQQQFPSDTNYRDEDFSYYMEHDDDDDVYNNDNNNDNDDDDDDNENYNNYSNNNQRNKNSEDKESLLKKNKSQKKKKLLTKKQHSQLSSSSIDIMGSNPSFENSIISKGDDINSINSNTNTNTNTNTNALNSKEIIVNENENLHLARISKRKRSILIIMCIIEIIACAVYSVMASFYSEAAQKKNVSDSMVGLIFAAFSLCIFIVSPVAGIWMSKIGRKKLLLIGIALEALSTIAFAFADFVDDSTSFVVLSFCLRSATGVGNALIITSAMAISILEFPDNKGMVLGIGELSQGIGLLASPPIGGFLYDAGGFKTPFLVVGSLLAALFPVIVYLKLSSSDSTDIKSTSNLITKGKPSSELRSIQGRDPLASFEYTEEEELELGDEERLLQFASHNGSLNSELQSQQEEPEPTQYFRPLPTMPKLLRLPRVWLSLLSLFTTIAGVTYFEPTLKNYFGSPDKFNYSSGIIGLLFLAISGTYAILAPFVGHLVDKKKQTLPFMGAGCLSAAVCYLLVGPSPILSFIPDKQEWLLWIIMLVLGSSMALIVVPTGPEIVSVCYMFDQGENLSDLVAGLLTSAASLGQAVGPLLGGTLPSQIGFAWGASVFSCALVTIGTTHLLIWVYSKFCKPTI